jgi:endonuclease I
MDMKKIARSPRLRLAIAFGLAVTVGAGTAASTAAADDRGVTGSGTRATATVMTVPDAIGTQDGTSGPVTGYVVGQPVSATTVLTSRFTADTAIALAASPTETAPARMLYVQVTAAFRADFGLRAHPGLLGGAVTVSGTLTPYFSHPGLKSPTSMVAGGATPAPTGGTTPTAGPTPTGGPTPTAGPTAGPGGPYDSTYYAPAIGKTGPALRAALHDIIKVQTKLSYEQVWDALKETDQDPANPADVILLYTGRSQAKTANGSGVDDWNREHVWAKSHGDFGTATGPGTDVHHLRPADVSVNSTRGSKDFDAGGTEIGEAPGNFTDADSFEPRDAVKGDVARMLMYMAVRYEGDDGWPDLELNDQVSNGTTPRIGRLSVLLTWNRQDPPDAFEQHRNQVIYDHWQHNRNPFVDHPEWAGAIWGG